MVQSLVYDSYQLLKQLVHREFGLRHLPENKPGFGYRLDLIVSMLFGTDLHRSLDSIPWHWSRVGLLAS